VKTLLSYLYMAATIAGLYYLCTPTPTDPVAAYSRSPLWIPEIEEHRAEQFPGTEPGDYSVIDELVPSSPFRQP
jgi:hypothetical protein